MDSKTILRRNYQKKFDALKKVMIEYNPAIHNIQKIDMIQSNGDNIAIEFKNINASSRKNIK